MDISTEQVKKWTKRVIILSRYTTTINDIINHFLSDKDKYNDISLNELVKKTHEKFFNFNYDFFTDNKDIKDRFEEDFLLTYLNEYIAYETLGMFRSALLAHLNTEMYWYKQMYRVINSGDDPFTNVRETTKQNKDNKKESEEKANYNTDSKTTGKSTSDYSDKKSGSEKSTNNSQSIHSDNPQVTIKTNDYASTMERGKDEISGSHSASGRGKRNESDTGTLSEKRKNDMTSNETAYEKIVNEKIGLNGISRADAIEKYASQIFNLEKMLIDSCSKLFLKVW